MDGFAVRIQVIFLSVLRVEIQENIIRVRFGRYGSQPGFNDILFMGLQASGINIPEPVFFLLHDDIKKVYLRSMAVVFVYRQDNARCPFSILRGAGQNHVFKMEGRPVTENP